MSRKVEANYSAEQVKSAFREFEGVNPPGFIRLDALVRALSSYGIDKLNEDQASELVNQIEVNSIGLINYNDYVDMMMST